MGIVIDADGGPDGRIFDQFRIELERGATLRVRGREETGPLLEIIPDAHSAHGETHQVDALPVNGNLVQQTIHDLEDGLAARQAGPAADSAYWSQQKGGLRLHVAVVFVPPLEATFLQNPFVRRALIATAVQVNHERVLAARLEIPGHIDNVFQRLAARTCPFAQLILTRVGCGLSPKRRAGERDQGCEEKNGPNEITICHAEQSRTETPGANSKHAYSSLESSRHSNRRDEHPAYSRSKDKPFSTLKAGSITNAPGGIRGAWVSNRQSCADPRSLTRDPGPPSDLPHDRFQQQKPDPRG